jgi:hypothetical protein
MATETSIIIGKTTNIGLCAAVDPERQTAVIMASVARDMTTGSKRTSKPDRTEGGRTGGAATAISADANVGGTGRDAGIKPTVAALRSPWIIGAP